MCFVQEVYGWLEWGRWHLEHNKKDIWKYLAQVRLILCTKKKKKPKKPKTYLLLHNKRNPKHISSICSYQLTSTLQRILRVFRQCGVRNQCVKYFSISAKQFLRLLNSTKHCFTTDKLTPFQLFSVVLLHYNLWFGPKRGKNQKKPKANLST